GISAGSEPRRATRAAFRNSRAHARILVGSGEHSLGETISQRRGSVQLALRSSVVWCEVRSQTARHTARHASAWLSVQPPVLQLDDSLAVSRVFLRVRYLNDGRARAIEARAQIHDLARLSGVQVARGRVGKGLAQL